MGIMVSPLNPRFLSTYTSISRAASGTVLVVGLLVLAGWLFDIAVLTSVLPGLATMKANTAVGFILASLSLWLKQTRRADHWMPLVANVCAAVTVLIGLLTLSEYAFHTDLGIDQLLFEDPLTPENAFPGRMSPVTALNLSLLGFVLLILDRRRYWWPVQVFGLGALLLSVLALIGYAYGVPSLYDYASYTPIAIHTALAVSILGVGILFARPERGLMKIFSGDNIGGMMARRLLPAAVLVPFVLGWLFLTGQRLGLYDSTFRLVLSTVSTILVFAMLIWWNAGLLQNTEFRRRQTQVRLSAAEEREAAILYASLDAVITIDHQGRVVEFNPAAQAIFGYERDQVLDREMSSLIIPPSLRERHRTGLAKYLATGVGPVLGKRIELTGMRADGTEFPVELTITPITAGEQPLFTGFVRDLTQRKQAEEELRRNTARNRALADLSHKLADVRLDYQQVLDTAARYTTELIGDACAIRLVSEDEQWLELVSLYHPEQRTLAFLREVLEANPLRTDAGLGARVIQTGRPVLIPVLTPDQQKELVPAAASSTGEPISTHSLLVVPLRAQGSVLGTVSMTRHRPNRPYTAEEQAFLQDLADRTALAIANARLYTAMQQLNNELEMRVTERTAQLQESEEQFSKAFLASPAAVSIASLPEGRYLNVNEALAKLTGYSKQELLGRTSAELGLVDATARQKIIEAIRRHGFAHNVEIQIHTKSKQIADVLISVEQMELGGEPCLLSVNFDITDRKRAEVELQKATLELEATNKELEAFSYSVSHDLRAPLRSIDGYSQALLEDYGDLLPAEGHDFLNKVRKSTQRMAELIDDLLKLSQVTRAQITFLPVDLTQLAENILVELQRAHPKRGVRFNVAPNLTARGDPRLLRVVLENLLNNAWKYTSRQEQAEIEVGSRSENGQTIFFVRDNGAGFDMAYVGRLFGAFQRLHTATEFPGTGIGLATVQRILHRHGGRAWAESEVGQGATFFFLLPVLDGLQSDAEPKEKDSMMQRAREII